MQYDYAYLSAELQGFPNLYSIGKTNENREIYCMKIGYGEKNAVFCASFHGLEYLTAPALLRFAKQFLEMEKYHNKLTLYIVPMVNPDGVEIAVNGVNPKNTFHHKLISSTGIIDFTKLWQANSSGVDINHNFDANWKNTILNPGPTKYGGEYPHSEKETQVVVNLLEETEPELFIAFHSQGKEIYYDFNGLENKFSKANARAVAEICGYKAVTPTGTASYGGAKDWYIQEYHKQAYTIELGKGKNPLPHSQLDEMARDVYKICMYLIDKIFL